MKMHNVEKILEDDLNNIPLGLYFSIIHRTHMIHLNHEMKDLNITAGQFPYLIYLSEKEGISQEELASYYHIDKGTVARALKKLEDNGFINREIDSENRRRYILHLTEKGKALVPKIYKVDAEWEKTVYHDFSESEKELLFKTMKKLAIRSLENVSYGENNNELR